MRKTNMSFLLAVCLMSSSVIASQSGKKQMTPVEGVPELVLEKANYVALHKGGLQEFVIDLLPGLEELDVINEGHYQNVLAYIKENYPNLNVYVNPLSRKITIKGDQVQSDGDELTEQVKKFLEKDQYNALENLQKLIQFLNQTTFYKKEPSSSEESDEPITTKEELLRKFHNGVLQPFDVFAGVHLTGVQYPTGDSVCAFQYFTEPGWIVTSDEEVLPFRSFIESHGGYITSKTDYEGSSSRLLYGLTEQEFIDLASALEQSQVFCSNEIERITLTANERLKKRYPQAKNTVSSVSWHTQDNGRPGVFVTVLGQEDLSKVVVLNEFDHFQSLNEFIGNKGGSVTPKGEGILITHQDPRALTKIAIELSQKGIYDISSK